MKDGIEGLDWAMWVMLFGWSAIVYVLWVQPLVARMRRYFTKGCWNHAFDSDPSGVRRIRCRKCGQAHDEGML